MMATMVLKTDPASLLAQTPLFGGLDEASRKAVAALQYEMRRSL